MLADAVTGGDRVFTHRLKTLLLASAIAAISTSSMADDIFDWSGWWGGISVGAGQRSYDASGINNRTLCFTDVSGPGASATCDPFEPSLQTSAILEDGWSENHISRSGHYSGSTNPTGGTSEATSIAYIDSFVDVFGGDGISAYARSVLELGPERVEAHGILIESVTGFQAPGELGDSGLMAGFHLRRDWQVGTAVLGLEAEVLALSGAGAAFSMAGQDLYEFFDLERSVTTRADALVAIKGRAGIAAGNTLWYATGGLGATRVSGTVVTGVSPVPGIIIDIPTMQSVQHASGWAVGPVIGAGAAWMIGDRVALSTESLVYLFGNGVRFGDGHAIGASNVWTSSLRLSVKLD